MNELNDGDMGNTFSGVLRGGAGIHDQSLILVSSAINCAARENS
jgi:hypothetical protein